MAKSKYYVVWKGHIPGIYKTWEECQQQITGFQNAHYKSYPTYEEAVSAYKNGKDNQSKPKLTPPIKLIRTVFVLTQLVQVIPEKWNTEASKPLREEKFSGLALILKALIT
ncbi:MAG: RNase H1/viroplasmin domain-containing protein [Saprospiraceae bacterium]|nr:RNase H1/viroplasmin domain-containing protein [Saprospiraceae bacterium]